MTATPAVFMKVLRGRGLHQQSLHEYIVTKRNRYSKAKGDECHTQTIEPIVPFASMALGLSSFKRIDKSATTIPNPMYFHPIASTPTNDTHAIYYLDRLRESIVDIVNESDDCKPHSKAHMMSNLEDEDLAPDATLLAVIGVLDAARDETSVVAWIHGGGLWVDDGTHENEAAKDVSPDAASAALSGVAPEDTKSTVASTL
ncbi:hypothetical protein PC9H_010262 [Pleurotus ostreatus]|uniref:Uncharacterized protein n=1 Tax=Pleurotus ostreatus TaxID=5322 RepID=A0A8H6ZS82_PLEOS|nr:uncharacterized protein PC9H_010262 [Pleurotus ostreatus]KAF7424951.1 hypothetical protein PC9H_010262 [Pleurotus ostreatus]